MLGTWNLERVPPFLEPGAWNLELESAVAVAGDVAIRRLRPGDGEQLTVLLSIAFAEEFSRSGTGPAAVQRQVRAATLASAPGVRRALAALGVRFLSFVATAGGRVVGSATVGGGRLLVVSSVAVLPEYRGLGLGRLLVDETHRYALAQGRDRVVLDVLSHNAPARRLYEALGYSEYHRFRAYELPALPARSVTHTPREFWLEPSTPRRTAAFASVERAALPPAYFEAVPTLRDRYVRSGASRWLERLAGGARSHQRTLVHDGRTAGYLAAVSAGDTDEGRIELPLVLPQACAGLPGALVDAVRFIEEAGHHRVRLDISETRPDQQACAESLDFRHRWTYIQMVNWLARPVRIPVRAVGSRQ